MNCRSLLVRFLLCSPTALIAACSGSDAGGVSTPPAPPVEQLVVSITPKRDSLTLGASRALGVSVTSTSGVARNVAVSWTSLTPAVATVSNGSVTALAIGEALVVASAGSAADTARIAVVPSQSSLQLSPGAVYAVMGDTITFEAAYVGATGAAMRASDIAWALSDSSPARLVGDGTVATTGEGTINVFATVRGTTATASIQVASASVASVTIVPNNLSLPVGASDTLIAQARDGRGRLITGRSVSWTSSNSSVATVAPNGAIVAKGVGGAVITATVGGRSATAAVNVYSAAAATVAITLPDDSLGLGRTMQATAQPLDLDGNLITGRPVAWQSSNPSVATITNTGLITAIAAGQTNISVICDGKTATQKLTVAASKPTTLLILPGTANLTVGTSSKFVAELRDQFGAKVTTGTVYWSSSAASVASISNSGSVTGVSLGSATIKAVSSELVATSDVSVLNVAVASVTLSPTSPSIEEGDVVILTATPRDSTGKVLANRLATWSSSSPAVATVSPTGTVTGVTAGKATISVNVEGKTAQTTVTVTVPPPPAIARVTVTLNSSVVSVGQVTSAVARVYDASGVEMLGVPVTFSSSAPSLASVAPDGRVTGVAAGSATISASADTARGIASVTVQPAAPLPVATVVLTAPTTTLVVSDSTPLSVVLKDSTGAVLTGRTISYTSSNLAVATVSTTGLLRAVGAGTATVTATSGTARASLTFTVTSAPSTAPASVATVSVALNSTNLVVGQGTQATVVLKDSVGNVLTGRTIAWSSSNAAAATVSQTGYVTATGAGSASISAQSGGKSGSASLTVTAPPVVQKVKTVTVTLSPASIVIGATTQATAVARDSAGVVMTGQVVSWSNSGGSTVATLASSSAGTTTAIGVSAGSTTITATIAGVVGTASLTVTTPISTTPPPATSIALPALPAILNVSYPRVTGKSWPVHAGDNLQSILNQAQRGDEIVIDAGATFTGNFTLPQKTGTVAGNGWIVIRSSKQSQLPPQGTRVTSLHAPLMPKIQSGNTMTALTAGVSTSGWWISGVEFSIAPTVTSAAGSIVAIGLATAAQNTLALAPTDFVLDRVYIHPQTTQSIQRCLELHAARVAVLDSYLVECHGKGFDSQAIVGWNGPGPYKIVNNTLAGAGENVMFGGADPKIPGVIASDIEIRRNYIYTPASWKGVWTKKNIFETKASQRVLIEGNVLEGSWTDAQTGYAFVLKVANQNGGCTWCISNDITIRNNIIRNVGAGIGITGKDGTNPIGELLSRLLIENNYIENVNTGIYSGAGRMVAIMNDAHDVTIRGNTMTAPGALSHYLSIATLSAATNFAFQNNIMTLGTYGMFSSWYGSGETPNLPAFNGSVVFQRSVLIGAAAKNYPNAQFVSSLSAAQATGYGANMNTINAATAGVIIP